MPGFRHSLPAGWAVEPSVRAPASLAPGALLDNPRSYNLHRNSVTGFVLLLPQQSVFNSASF
jgi:hypothetical protein